MEAWAAQMLVLKLLRAEECIPCALTNLVEYGQIKSKRNVVARSEFSLMLAVGMVLGN